MELTLREFMKLAGEQRHIELYDFDDTDYISRDLRRDCVKQETYGGCTVVGVRTLIRGDRSGGAQSVLHVEVQKPEDFFEED